MKSEFRRPGTDLKYIMSPSTNHSTQDRWKLLLAAALVCVGISALIAGANIAVNVGFGASDILPFLISTLPFAVAIALIKYKLKNLLRQLPIPLGYVVAATIGLAGGVLWTYVVAFFLGAWFGAFSFPVLSCWIAGGASGMIAGSGNYKSVGRAGIVELIIIAVISLSSMTMPKYLFDSLSNNQKLEVDAAEWIPGPEPLTVEEVVNLRPSDKDVARLAFLGLTGRVSYAGGSGFVGRGKPARALIVMQRQLTEPISLPQPDGVEVTYIQGDDGWKMYPSDAPTLQRTIRLWPDEKDPGWATRYSIERADGTSQGGTLFTWSSP